MRAGEIISFECKSVTLCGLLAAWSGVQFVHLSLFIFIRCSLILRATVLRVQAVPSAALPQAAQVVLLTPPCGRARNHQYTQILYF